MKLKLWILFCLLSFSASNLYAFVDCQNPRSVHTNECEVTIRIQMWNYQRIYPLLDGLFQDIDATQVGSLVLNPNTSNGSQVDAVMQSVQAQIGYSQLAGAQNQAAVQMMQANTAAQSTLLQTQSSLMTTLVTQEQGSSAAQAKQAQDAQAGAGQDVLNADQAQVTSTGAAVQATKDALTAISTQLANTPYSPSAASGSVANSTAAPTPMSASTFTSGNSSAPSFPATKQMDNQVQLLWERLARVVGAMVKADSSNPTDSLYFVQFDLGIFPLFRKGRLLDVYFPMKCGDGTGPQPTVVDLFPRVAALNLSETKYRDKQWSIATALQWLGFGVNSSFYREHLQLSQVLGQSSYITGRGIGQSSFGWRYGIALGDTEMSADTRTTFALISVPEGCTPYFGNADMRWIRRNSKPADPWYAPRNEDKNESRFKSDASLALTSAFQTAQKVNEDSVGGDTNPLIRKIYVNRAKDTNGDPAVNLAIELRGATAANYSAIDEGYGSSIIRLKKVDVTDLSKDSWSITPDNQISLRLNPIHFSAGFPAIALRSGVNGDLLVDQWIAKYCPTIISYNIAFTPKIGGDGKPLCGPLIARLATVGPPPNAPQSWLREIRFNRTAYSAALAPMVSVTLSLSDDLDQQTSITADDIILRRIRDPFGRAVNLSAPTGLLESSTIAPNTWMILNSRTITLNLDSSTFGQHFPNIVLTSPAGSRDLRSALTTPDLCPVIDIAGRNVDLNRNPGVRTVSCLDLLTSLAYKTGSRRTLGAVRVLQGQRGRGARIVFTDVSAPPSTNSAPVSTSAQVQVNAGQRGSIWGYSTEVYELNHEDGSMQRLQCDPPSGSRYACYLSANGDATSFERTTLQVIDLNHTLDQAGTVGTLESWPNVDACDDNTDEKCRVPSFWDFHIEPKVEKPTGTIGWTVTFQFVNVPKDTKLTGTLTGFTVQAPPSEDESPTLLSIDIDAGSLAEHKLTDRAVLKVSCSLDPCKIFPEQSVTISNLYSHFLPIADPGTDWTNWTGTNLLSSYQRLQIGDGTPHNISCDNLARCELKTGNFDKDESGAIFLIDSAGEKIPLLQVANGKITNAQYTKPKSPAVGGKGNGGGTVVILNGANPSPVTVESLLPDLGAQQQINTQPKL